MSDINITLDEKLLKTLIIEYFEKILGSTVLEARDVTIQVKSKQNYKSEWESATFRAILYKTL